LTTKLSDHQTASVMRNVDVQFIHHRSEAVHQAACLDTRFPPFDELICVSGSPCRKCSRRGDAFQVLAVLYPDIVATAHGRLWHQADDFGEAAIPAAI
jgi:hypothetical protein